MASAASFHFGIATVPARPAGGDVEAGPADEKVWPVLADEHIVTITGA